MSGNYTTGNPVFSRFFQNIPDYPHCTDNLAAGCRQAPKHLAIKRRYIQLNKPNYSHNYLGLDLDYEGAGIAWHDLDLPCPTFSIVNPENAHGLTAYELTTPVHLGSNASERAIRFLDAVRKGYIKKLDADPSFTEFLSKNPLSTAWRVFSCNVTYTLDELAEPLREITPEQIRALPDDDLWHEHLRKYHIPLYERKPSNARITSDDPTDSLFVYHNTRWYAYIITADCKRYGQLHERIEVYIRKLDRDFGLNLSESQIRSDTNSIAKFCWRHRAEFIARRNAFCELHRERAYLSHNARKRNTATKISYARRELRKEGKLITKSALAEVSGVSVQSLAKRNLKTDLSEIRSGNAHQTAEIKRAATESKIKQAFEQALRDGIKPTQKNVATLAGVGIATVKRYWQQISI